MSSDEYKKIGPPLKFDAESDGNIAKLVQSVNDDVMALLIVF